MSHQGPWMNFLDDAKRSVGNPDVVAKGFSVVK
jgi:hypothetical protein